MAILFQTPWFRRARSFECDSEHRCSSCLSFRSLPFRWDWTSSNRVHWCSYNDVRYVTGLWDVRDAFLTPWTATAVQGASQSVGMFIGARYDLSELRTACTYKGYLSRFLIGFGLTFAGALTFFSQWEKPLMNFAANAAPMLVSEISYPKYR